MRESVELVELILLEKVGKDCWKFRAKPNASFDAVFETLKKAHAFNAATSYRWDEKKEHHLINDQGIWLLSHVFSNWDEMFEQATKKSPWEQAWQKRAEEKAEQGEPEQKYCMTCGVDEFNDLCFCYDCKQWFCLACWDEHLSKHETKKKQEAYTLYRCSGCSKIAMNKDPNRSGSPYWQCPTCYEYYCETCCYRHTHTHQSYSARTEYGFTPDDMRDFERYYRLYQNGIWSEAQFQEYFFGQKSQKAKAEEEERKRQEEARQREKQRQEEWFRDFWGAGQQTSSTELESAFTLLNLSTRATVQEVKRAFRRKAKEAHPDKEGGSEQAFKALNAAYQLALSHAERNEVK